MYELDEATIAGQAVYSTRALRSYDFVVLTVSNRWIWKCPTPRLLEHYNQHVSGNHLDVGVGTGYFVDRCRFPVEQPRVALMDLNANTLNYAGDRIAHYQPEKHQRNVLEPIEFDRRPFDSIAVNYLFHCLPGEMQAKSVAFGHLSRLGRPGTKIFGSTLVQGDVARSGAAKRLMAFYNRKGIFANDDDTLEGLRAALEQRFDDVETDVVGCAVLFSATIRDESIRGSASPPHSDETPH